MGCTPVPSTDARRPGKAGTPPVLWLRVHLIVAFALLFGVLPAAEGGTDTVEDGSAPGAVETDDGSRQRIDLLDKRLRVGGGFRAPLRTGVGELRGGVHLVIGGLALRAERVDFRLDELPGGAAWPSRADLLPAAGERIAIDTRAGEFDSLAFRGLLEPRRGRMTIDEVDEQEGLLHYRLQLQKLDAFEGALRDSQDRWLPVSGGGGELTMQLVADLDDGELYDPRLRSIRLRLPAEAGASDTVRLTLDRPHQGERLVIDSDWVALQFDERGRLFSYGGGPRSVLRSEALAETTDAADAATAESATAALLRESAD